MMGDENGSEKAAPKKFVFECQMCGESCKRRAIPVVMDDLARWVADGTIERLLAFLQLEVVDGEMLLVLAKGEDEHCPLYHADSGKCTIHYNKPLDCRAFPLGHDGDRYYVRFRDCPGLDKGDMTPEELAAMREDARAAFEGGAGMAAAMPILQMVFYRKIMDDSVKAMESLSDKDREVLDGILEKTKKTAAGGGDDDVEEVEIRLDGEGGTPGGNGKGDGHGGGGVDSGGEGKDGGTGGEVKDGGTGGEGKDSGTGGEGGDGDTKGKIEGGETGGDGESGDSGAEAEE